VVAEWVAVEDTQKEFNRKRAAYGGSVESAKYLRPADLWLALDPLPGSRALCASASSSCRPTKSSPSTWAGR
jgi:hypothetical protein